MLPLLKGNVFSVGFLYIQYKLELIHSIIQLLAYFSLLNLSVSKMTTGDSPVVTADLCIPPGRSVSRCLGCFDIVF